MVPQKLVESSTSVVMDAEASKKERLNKEFLELQSVSSDLANFIVQWRELDCHFNELEKLMQKRFEELERKEKENEKEKKSAAEKNTGNPNDTPEKNSAAEKSTGNSNEISEEKFAAESSTGYPNETSEKKSTAEKSTGNPTMTSLALNDDVKPPPKLISLCEEMDGEGLINLFANSRPGIRRHEVPAALRYAADPAKLVLQVLACVYVDGNAQKSYTYLLGQRNACNLLLDSLRSVLTPDKVSSEAKNDAQKIAAAWKSKLNLDSVSQITIVEARAITIVEARAFLKLLVSYGISKEFKDDDLCELVLRIFRHTEVFELCHALQISHKIPDVVEKLSRSGRQMEAIQFIYEFDLVEKIPPVPLLKAYLKEQKQLLEELAERESNAVGAQVFHVLSQNDATKREIESLNTVIKCIKEHELESEMSTEDLEERVVELEKTKKKQRSAEDIKSQTEGAQTKEEKKRSVEDVTSQTEGAQTENKKRIFAEDIKSQTKRVHPSGGGGVAGAGAGADDGSLLPKLSPPNAFAISNSSAPLPKTTTTSAFTVSNSSALLPKPTPPSVFSLSNSSELYRPSPVVSIPSYNSPGQGVYDRGSEGIYRSAYVVGSNPSSLSRSYLYPSDSLQSSLYGAGSFHGSTSYATYNIGSGVPPATYNIGSGVTPATSYKYSYLH